MSGVTRADGVRSVKVVGASYSDLVEYDLVEIEKRARVLGATTAKNLGEAEELRDLVCEDIERLAGEVRRLWGKVERGGNR